jgi:deoxycytidylate deaminase
MMRIAGKQADKAPQNLRHKLGAVVVKGGRILSTGYNEVRYTKELKKPTLHAEQSAILKLLKRRRLHDLVGSSIYVYRRTPGGNLGNACPCSVCMDLIRSVGIKRVFYTEDNNTMELTV